MNHLFYNFWSINTNSSNKQATNQPANQTKKILPPLPYPIPNSRHNRGFLKKWLLSPVLVFQLFDGHSLSLVPPLVHICNTETDK